MPLWSGHEQQAEEGIAQGPASKASGIWNPDQGRFRQAEERWCADAQQGRLTHIEWATCISMGTTLP